MRAKRFSPLSQERPSSNGVRAQCPEGLDIRALDMVYPGTRGAPVPVIAQTDLTIKSGEFVSLIGPSGCGKSTLLKIVAGLLKPTSGTVRINGEDVRGPRSDVSVMFQSPILLPWRTVFENVMFAVDFKRGGRQAHEARAKELLELVGIADFADRHPYELSGGMQQRNALARSLLRDPRMLLMDEPFGALDALTRDSMMIELQSIWMRTQSTVVLVTHSIPEAMLLSDRVLVLSDRPTSIISEFRMDFERPRSLELLGDTAFGELSQEIRGLLQPKASERRGEQ